MKKITLVALTLILTLGVFLTVASPASACVVGYSPGYWKNHPEAWAAKGISPSDTINNYFGVNRDPDVTLMQALQTGKNSALFGDPAGAFWREVVAQLLNSALSESHINWLKLLVAYGWDTDAKQFQPAWEFSYYYYEDGVMKGGDWGLHTLEEWKDALASFNL